MPEQTLQSLLLGPRRPYSIKTRIKTAVCLPMGLPKGARRPYSIKTRIKTVPVATTRQERERILADHIPLKQGLRL